MDALTRLDPTRPINKFLKGAGRNATEGVKEELKEVTDYVFDEKLAPLIYMINCIMAERIKQANDAGIGLVKYSVDSISDLKNQLKGDIEDLLKNVDQRYKENLRGTFEEINEAWAKIIADLRQTINTVDSSLEALIKKLFLGLMTALIKVEEISDQFTPGAFRKQLIEPSFKELKAIEKQFYQDLDKILNKGAQVTDFAIDEFDNRILKKLDFIEPRFGIGNKNILGLIPASSLTDMERYRYLCAVELDKIEQYIIKNESIQKIVDSYIQLQFISSRMYFKAITQALPMEELKDSCLRGWAKYGVAIKLWESCLV